MAIFQKDNTVETTWEYKITTVSVSLLTYLVAIISGIAVDWEHVKHKCGEWWQRLVSHYGPNPGGKSGLAPAKPEPKPEEVGNLAELTSGGKEPDIGVNEGNSKAVKSWLPWFAPHRNSLHKQAKRKEPDQDQPTTGEKLDV
jgi:hypothetical protein